MPVPAAIAKEVVAVAHRLDAKGLVSATDGNISVRLTDGNFLVTPSGKNKSTLTVRDLIVVGPDGSRVRGTSRPSTELKMHLAIYRHRPDVHAVVHAHPVHATAFAVSGKRIPADAFPEAIVQLGEIPLAPYATPSTDEVEASLLQFLADHSAILMANHGAVTFGKSVWDACHLMEKVEQLAHITVVADAIGGVQRLSPEKIAVLKQLAVTVYNRG